jgi:hypothetical protein
MRGAAAAWFDLPMRTCAPLFVVVLLLAACGGSDSSSSDPGSVNYDPAHSTLKKAGLEVCGEATRDLPAGVTTLEGAGSAKAFYVAKDCKGAKTTPNSVYVVQFTSVETIGPGEQKIKRTLPGAATLQHYPLVIATTGPDKDANLAAIKAQLPPSAVTTTS